MSVRGHLCIVLVNGCEVSVDVRDPSRLVLGTVINPIAGIDTEVDLILKSHDDDEVTM